MDNPEMGVRCDSADQSHLTYCAAYAPAHGRVGRGFYKMHCFNSLREGEKKKRRKHGYAC